jgi:hypothetical protein
MKSFITVSQKLVEINKAKHTTSFDLKKLLGPIDATMGTLRYLLSALDRTFQVKCGLTRIADLYSLSRHR